MTAAETISADYLVIGAGAGGMAFVDSLLTHGTGSIILADRRPLPGGHWNDAYPFLALHSPSAYYGVESRELDPGTPGPDGMAHRAGATEILQYYQDLLRERFLPAGRVRFMAQCDYRCEDGTHILLERPGGKSWRVEVTKKLVDATLAGTCLPQDRPPPFALADGVRCITPNALAQTDCPGDWVVVGAGKTAMDCVLWLLDQGTPPERIVWIRPRDHWLLNRANMQPGPSAFDSHMGAQVAQLEAIVAASSQGDLFDRLEAGGQLLRLDGAVQPDSYRCATITLAEAERLRRVERIIRQGHLVRASQDSLQLEQSRVRLAAGSVLIDCTARGVNPPTGGSVFEPARINLLLIRPCQPLLSAAFAAVLETYSLDDTDKNRLARVIGAPSTARDWLVQWHFALAEGSELQRHPALAQWQAGCRLNMMASLMPRDGVLTDQHGALLQRLHSLAPRAADKLLQLLATESR